MSLNRKRLALIHVAKKRLNLDDETYRDILLDFGGVETSSDLNESGFALVMNHFATLGFTSTKRRHGYGERAFMASPGQIALIRHLWADYTDGQGTDLSLGKWLERIFKVSALRFLPVGLAPKAITALKAMTARKLSGARASL